MPDSSKRVQYRDQKARSKNNKRYKNQNIKNPLVPDYARKQGNSYKERVLDKQPEGDKRKYAVYCKIPAFNYMKKKQVY